MKKTVLTGLLISSQLLSGKSLSFQYYDWQVVCDNTHVCRIAGYSSDYNITGGGAWRLPTFVSKIKIK